MPPTSTEFAKRWFAKGQCDDDPFDRFVSLYIALVMVSRGLELKCRADDDRCYVIGWFNANADRIVPALDRIRDRMVELAERHGTRTGKPIVDPPVEEGFSTQMEKLAVHFKGGAQLKNRPCAGALGTLLVHVRNNLLHGRKDYADHGDQTLVGNLAAVMATALDAVERFTPPAI